MKTSGCGSIASPALRVDPTTPMTVSHGGGEPGAPRLIRLPIIAWFGKKRLTNASFTMATFVASDPSVGPNVRLDREIRDHRVAPERQLIDDCSQLSRAVSDLLEEATLEVDSLGRRPVTHLRQHHLERAHAVGDEPGIDLGEPVGAAKEEHRSTQHDDGRGELDGDEQPAP